MARPRCSLSHRSSAWTKIFVSLALGLGASAAQSRSPLPHAELIRTWDEESFQRGKALYELNCIQCHGAPEAEAPPNPLATAFAQAPLKYGNQPHQMFRVITDGTALMPPHGWLEPRQRYDAVHFIREAFLETKNRTQYFPVDEDYLKSLAKLQDIGPSGVSRPPMDYGPAMTYEVEDCRSALVVTAGPGVYLYYDLLTLSAPVAWEGGFLDLTDTHHLSYKGGRRGRIAGTRLLLGSWQWLLNGSLENPRPGGRLDVPVKPELARYHGHHIHGDRTLVSYSIEGVGIVETPVALRHDDWLGLHHHLEIAPNPKPLTLCVGQTAQPGSVTPEAEVSAKAFIVGEGAYRVGAIATGDIDGLRWSSDAAGRAFLTFPPRTSARKVSVVRAAVADDADLDLLAGTTNGIDVDHGTTEPVTRYPLHPRTNFVLGDATDPYVLDEVEIPFENPWHSWMRLTDFDFFPDGRLAVSTLNGDVWLVSGLDSENGSLTWKRHATGLYEPLGLLVADGNILVTCRDRIVRLHDRNADGEADEYESFHALPHVGSGYHAFNFGLHRDAVGNLYFAKSGYKNPGFELNGALIRLSPDGRDSSNLAKGFRQPNGMTVDPSGSIFVSDNQGTWMPASKISHIDPVGGFFGYEPETWRPGERDFIQPMLWLPHAVDSSSGGQVRAPEDWGPLSQCLLHTSYGKARAFYCFEQTLHGKRQAYAVAFPWTFEAGVMRGRVNPADGQVWLCGQRGWDNKVPRDGTLTRIRHTGAPAPMITGCRLVAGGIELTFGVPLGSRLSTGNFALHGWNYLYSGSYGSEHYKPFDTKGTQKGEQRFEIHEVNRSNDGRILMIEVPELQPVDQMRLEVNVPTRAGGTIEQEVYLTIHHVVD